MKVTRTVVDAASGRSMPVEKILTIDVKPGWKAGTKITFPGEGDEEPGVQPGDIVFIVEEVPHEYLKREGDDLVHTANITLRQALTGCVISFSSLDGRPLRYVLKEVLHPGYQKVIEGEGMPNSKNPSQKGRLILRFNVEWPRSITDAQREQLKKIL